MQDLLVVSVLDSQANLSEPVEDLIFCEVLGFATSRFCLGLRLDLTLQVAVVAVVLLVVVVEATPLVVDIRHVLHLLL